MLMVALVLALVASACSGDDASDTTTSQAPPETLNLVGSWERVGGDFNELTGMVVTVASVGADGIVTSTPPNQYGFVVGDTKWTAISEVEPGEFIFDDLLRETSTDSTSYVPGAMTVAEDGTTLEMSFDSGSIQDWQRTS